MTKKKSVVVVGSGIVGCNVAYHLTKLGWKDVLVLDKGELYENDGSTSHAPGGVVALAHSEMMTKMAIYSATLFKNLEPFDGPRNTFNAVGGLELAISDARYQDLVRLAGEVIDWGGEAELLTPLQAKEKLPFLNEKAFVGGLFAPQAALISGSHVSGALARDAMATGGAEFIGHTMVTDCEVTNGQVTAVLTNNPEHPRIECEQVVLCTNIWGPVLGDKLGVHIPLMSFEHQYVFTEPLDELSQFDPANKDDEVIYPTFRELDSTIYARQHHQSYGVGSYWHNPHMIDPKTIHGNAMNPFTPPDFENAWNQMTNLMPMLKGKQFTNAFNGMFAFSVDGFPIIGPSRNMQGLWVATASWITHSAGVAKSLAEWMTHGESEWDLRQAHLYRFQPLQTTKKYIHITTSKNYREVYDIIHPKQPITEPRNIRLTPFYERLKDLSTEFTPFAGLELPNWSEENSRLLEKYEDQIPAREGWGAQFWSPIQGAEHLATRENVSLFDLTGLSIIEVKGPGALDYVQKLCTNNMNKPVGQVVYTLWLTPSGGIKRDLAVVRMDDDTFWMFVGEGTLPMDYDWVVTNAPADGSVAISDISNAYSAVGLWGPNARKVLEKVTLADISNEAFPFYTAQWIEIGMTRVLAIRISYAGELGWELHIPMDASLNVWDEIWEAGREFDMIIAGMGAFDSLRLEKGYRGWGSDIYTEYNPYEAGLGWTVKLKSGGDFIGRKAAADAKREGPKKKLSVLTLDDPAATLMGYEPIFSNGDCIGHVTTANYGYSVGKYIAFGYIKSEYAAEGTELEVMYFGNRYKAVVGADPLFDPKSERMRM